MAATLGITIDIPMIIRILVQLQYPTLDTTPDYQERSFDLFLDAGCDEEDLTAVAPSYLNDWWLYDQPDTAEVYLHDTNLPACLEHHRKVTGIKGIEPPTYSKPSYSWSRHLSSAYFNMDNPGCTKCRLYRGVTLAMLDDLQDLRRAVEGLEVSYEASADLTERRAAGFFKLYEAAAQKESNVSTPDLALALATASKPSKGKGKAKASGNLSRMIESHRITSADELARYKNLPELKWTCGEPLNISEAIQALKHSPHSGRQHSGYMLSLPEDPHDNGSNSSVHASPAGTPKFDDLAHDNLDVPELGSFQCPHHFSYPPLRHDYGGPPSAIPTLPPSPPPFIPFTKMSIPHPPPLHQTTTPTSSTRGHTVIDLTGSINDHDVAAYTDSNPLVSSSRGITGTKPPSSSPTRGHNPSQLTSITDEEVTASDVFADSDVSDPDDVAAPDIFSDSQDEPAASTSGHSDDQVAADDIYSDSDTDHDDVDADNVFSSEDADDLDADDEDEAHPDNIFSDDEGGPSGIYFRSPSTLYIHPSIPFNKILYQSTPRPSPPSLQTSSHRNFLGRFQKSTWRLVMTQMMILCRGHHPNLN
jgi:hypothetical protein